MDGVMKNTTLNSVDMMEVIAVGRPVKLDGLEIAL